MKETVEVQRNIEADEPEHAVSDVVAEFTIKHDQHMVKKVEAHNCADGSWLVTVEGGFST